MKLCDIKTIEELDTCRKDIRRKIAAGGEAVETSFRHVREEYSPGNIIFRSLGAVSDIFPFRELLLTAVTCLIKKMKK